jgi:hypothetical protein
MIEKGAYRKTTAQRSERVKERGPEGVPVNRYVGGKHGEGEERHAQPNARKKTQKLKTSQIL